MTILHQFVSRNPELLLRAAASGFLAPVHGTLEHPFPSPPYLLVLRQGGLRDDLIRLAAQATPPVRGWFDPPLCVFKELPEWLGATTRKPCGEYERLVLIAALLRTSEHHIFSTLRAPAAYVGALDRIFGELASEAVSAEQLAEALARLSAMEDAGARGPCRDEFERIRDAGLLALYTSYLERLDRAGLRDGRDALVDCAIAIERDPAALATRLGGRREIRILGLGDLRDGWRRLLGALAASPALDRIGIFTSSPLGCLPVDSGITQLDAGDTLADRLFTSTVMRGPERITLLAAPDESREVEHIAVRVRALVDRGVAPHRIAIVARDARPYLDLALDALRRVGVPATLRTRIPYVEIPVVRAVLALLAAATDGFVRHGLVELAEQPYIGATLDAEIINRIGYQHAVHGLAGWDTALRSLEKDAAANENDPDAANHVRRPPPPLARVRAAREAFEQFAGRAAVLTGEHPLPTWLDWLAHLTTEDPWDIATRLYEVPREECRLARADAAAWDRLRTVAVEWRDALRKWDADRAILTAGEFHDALRAMLAGDVALHGGPAWGVPLLEASAAEYRAFDYVFFAGCDTGRVPRRAPHSPILDDADRAAFAAAGLPLEQRADWDARERELLRMLVAAARRRLTLSCATLDSAGFDVLPSTLIDAVGDAAVLCVKRISPSMIITPHLPLYREQTVPARAHRAARIERVRHGGEISVYNGLIQHPALRRRLAIRYGDDYLWSPTQLEGYAKCPWAHFSARLLGLEERADPEADLDAAAQGTIMHAVLQHFYDAACARVGAPVMLRNSDREWVTSAIPDALDAVLDDTENLHWTEHPALRAVERAELLRTLARFVDFEIERNEACFSNRGESRFLVRTGVERSEVALTHVALRRGGIQIRYRGTADRVERGVDERFPSARFIAAVDYKRTAYSTPGAGKVQAWEDGVVLQVPLYLHALTTVHPADTAVRVEYRALRRPAVVHRLNLFTVEKNAHDVKEDAGAQARLEKALDDAVLHVRGVRDGCFPAAPASSCGCPPFCHARDICRVKGGPKQSGGTR